MTYAFLVDLRHALRGLSHRPGFSALVIVTLGLGTGANAAIFGAVDSLLLRDPPFKAPAELVRITATRGAESGGTLSTREVDDLLTVTSIAEAAMYTDQGMYNASGFGTPEELPATITTHNLFRVLGVEPFIGSTSRPRSIARAASGWSSATGCGCASSAATVASSAAR